MKKFLAALAFAGTVVVTVCASAQCRPAVSDCPGHTGSVLAIAANWPACASTHSPTTADCDAYPLDAPPPAVVGTDGDTITLRSPRPPRPRPRRVTVRGRDSFARSEINRVEVRLNDANGATNRNFANTDAMLEAARRLTFEATSPLTSEVVRIEQQVAPLPQQVATATTTANAALAADALELRAVVNYGLVLGAADMVGGMGGAGWRHRLTPEFAFVLRTEVGMGHQTAINGHGPLVVGHTSLLGLIGSGTVRGLIGFGGYYGGFIGSPLADEYAGVSHVQVVLEGGVRIQASEKWGIELLLAVGRGMMDRTIGQQVLETSGWGFNSGIGVTWGSRP